MLEKNKKTHRCVMCTLVPLLDLQYELTHWHGFTLEPLDSVSTNKGREMASLRCGDNIFV